MDESDEDDHLPYIGSEHLDRLNQYVVEEGLNSEN